MDFIFDDEAEDVGSDIEAYCPKCKSDTAHTVITKYEEEVRRVQCSVCGDVHTFRKPRGEEADDGSPDQPAAAKKRLAARKPSWQEAKDRAGNKGLATARPYSIRDTYDEGDVVTHPKFGVGFVTEITENKVEVTFEDERRVLIHNRPDLAAQMPSIATIPAPRAEKKKKGKGKGRGKAAAEPAPAPEPPPPPPPAAAAKEAKPAKGGKAAPVEKAEPEKAVAKPAKDAGKPVKAAPASPMKGAKAVAKDTKPAKAAPAGKKAAPPPPKAAAKPTGKKPAAAAAKKPAKKPAGKPAKKGKK
jgi:hypothetical protein